jgi:hypothetical protein
VFDAFHDQATYAALARELWYKRCRGTNSRSLNYTPVLPTKYHRNIEAKRLAEDE